MQTFNRLGKRKPLLPNARAETQRLRLDRCSAEGFQPGLIRNQLAVSTVTSEHHHAPSHGLLVTVTADVITYIIREPFLWFSWLLYFQNSARDAGTKTLQNQLSSSADSAASQSIKWTSALFPLSATSLSLSHASD